MEPRGVESGPRPEALGRGQDGRGETAEERGPSWHSIEPARVLGLLGSTTHGLSEAEARARLVRDGPNLLAERRPEGALRRLLRQLDNVLIYLLLAAAVVTAALGDWLDTWVILGVVVINAIIGFLQEGKAERALEAIRGMLSPQALVQRGGERRLIAARDLVAGDVVHLEAGDRVPADLRLFDLRNLRIDEAVLTGESVPVEKSVENAPAEVPLGERRSMAFSGTLVTYGIGTGVVVATSTRTELGRISTMLETVEALQTPLLRQLARFGRQLSVVIAAVAAATFAFGSLVRGYGVTDMFSAAVSLAVAAIPEGLPALMSITLALGVQKMARRNAIIRRLPAVETLGSVTVICSDKTGTLTRNEMTVRTIALADRVYEVSGVGYAPEGGFARDGREVDPREDPLLIEALRGGSLCNQATLTLEQGEHRMHGDPTEGALVTAAAKAELDVARLRDEHPRIDVIPFESEQRYMATLHHDHARADRTVAYVKGAPDRILWMCRWQRTDAGVEPLAREAWQARMDAIAREGQRVLAITTKSLDAPRRELVHADVEEDLALVALFGIIDPPRREAVDAVGRCRSAGIRVKMITGDHAATALAIASDLGIGDGRAVLTGPDIERLGAEALERAALDVDVFARAAPAHKLRLVGALQAQDQVVAMTGDGVNDAPALKRAEIGIAMGIKGTEAAKEASAMVLADDNFASIASAVEEGRTVYANLQKALLFILPTNGGQGFTVVAAVLAGLELPLLPVQVLWVNMVSSVTLGLALAFEPTEPGTMARPPRPPSEPLVSGFLLWRVVFVSVLLVAGTFGHFLWMRSDGASLELARTAAINTLVGGQIVYLFNCRFLTRSSLTRRGLFDNRAVFLAIGVLTILQGLFSYAPPVTRLFGTAPIDVGAWGRIAAFSILVFFLVEVEKAIVRRRDDSA